MNLALQCRCVNHPHSGFRELRDHSGWLREVEAVQFQHMLAQKARHYGPGA